MRIKLVIFIAILAVGAGLFIRAASNNSSVRGQDPNVEARGTNTAGEPLVGTSGASDPTAGSTAGHDGRTGARPAGWRGDGGWVMDAAEMGAAEAALAALAERRAMTAEVKAYAAELKRDHTRSSDELKALAAGKRWAMPGSVDVLHAQALRALEQAQNPEFERAYVDAMIVSHEKALASFRIAAASASDPELKAWSARQIPALEQHLEHARRLK